MLVAVLDVGSNTVRLLVAEVGRNGALETVKSDKAYLGLGAEIACTGSLAAESVAGAANVCRRFAERARAEGSERAEVIVTAPGRQGAAAATLVAALRGRDAPAGAGPHGRRRGPARLRRRRRARLVASGLGRDGRRRRRLDGDRRGQPAKRRALGRLGGSRLAPPDATRAERGPAVEEGACGCARDGPERALAALAAAPGGRARGGWQRPGAREARRQPDVRRARRPRR